MLDGVGDYTAEEQQYVTTLCVNRMTSTHVECSQDSVLIRTLCCSTSTTTKTTKHICLPPSALSLTRHSSFTRSSERPADAIYKERVSRSADTLHPQVILSTYQVSVF